MKKVLALLLISGAMQGSLLLGNNENRFYEYYVQELNVLGGFGNLEKHLPNSEITKECLAISRPWNWLYNAFTVNDATDFYACDNLNKEFAYFQQKFLKEASDKNVIDKHIFYAQYFANNYSKHEAMISKVFYREPRKLDRKVMGELPGYQNALRKSTESL